AVSLARSKVVKPRFNSYFRDVQELSFRGFLVESQRNIGPVSVFLTSFRKGLYDAHPECQPFVSDFDFCRAGPTSCGQSSRPRHPRRPRPESETCAFRSCFTQERCEICRGKDRP